MPGELGAKALYDYTSDDTATYCVRMRTALATQGGFSASSSTQPNYPRGWRMRYVLGRASDGTKKKLHCSENTNSKFQSGGTFSVAGETYTIMGREGERRHS